MVHDFVVTARHLVIVIPPLVFEPVPGGEALLDALVWRPGLVHSGARGRQERFRRPALVPAPRRGSAFTTGNGWEDASGVIRFDHCVANDAALRRGPAACMRQAIDMAGLTPDGVDLVCAHGTGTLLNDRTEAKALRNVFGPRGAEIPCASIKSMLGHTLGAAVSDERGRGACGRAGWLHSADCPLRGAGSARSGRLLRRGASRDSKARSLEYARLRRIGIAASSWNWPTTPGRATKLASFLREYRLEKERLHDCIQRRPGTTSRPSSGACRIAIPS